MERRLLLTGAASLIATRNVLAGSPPNSPEAKIDKTLAPIRNVQKLVIASSGLTTGQRWVTALLDHRAEDLRQQSADLDQNLKAFAANAPVLYQSLLVIGQYRDAVSNSRSADRGFEQARDRHSQLLDLAVTSAIENRDLAETNRQIRTLDIMARTKLRELGLMVDVNNLRDSDGNYIGRFLGWTNQELEGYLKRNNIRMPELPRRLQSIGDEASPRLMQ